ncbi:MAG: cysteine desulfurase family protein [Flectobacillus sp.]|jgi:cysteine desulfurase|nr:cysteine desulfurase family protein [Flectobacillus sp.]
MNSKFIYLDYNATTPCDADVVSEMLPYFTEYHGNASSVHYNLGWKSKSAVDKSREHIANLINANANEIIFTSGATEGNNLAIRGVFDACKEKGNHIITCETEHKATLDTLKYLQEKGAEITYLKVNIDGSINLEEVKEKIKDTTILICLMFANNETGVVHPIKELGKFANENNVIFMTDATQAVGKIPIDVSDCGVDILTFSAHKMYGPKGIGAIYVKENKKKYLTPQITGGGHENGLRSGTLNVPSIVGFGKASKIAKEEINEKSYLKIKKLRIKLEDNLVDCNSKLNGLGALRLPHVANISFPEIDGKRLLKLLNKFVAVSSGSACSSSSLETSHVLKAMGIDSETAQATIRFSLGKNTTEQEIDFTISKVKEILEILDKSKN